MSSVAVSRPYAAAAFAIAEQDNTIEHWETMLTEMAKVVTAAEEAARSGKMIADVDVANIILEMLTKDMTDNEKNFLQVLVENKRVFVLPAIVERFQQLHMAAQEIVFVRVESAMPISDVSAFEKFLEKKVNKKVEVSFEENASLLGGVRIYINDDVIDASIAGRLKQLSTALG